MEEEIQCPNNCGKLEVAYGRIDTNNGNSWFKVTVEYCPECGYIGNADANW
jgi:uncharacterized Zn finger protein